MTRLRAGVGVAALALVALLALLVAGRGEALPFNPAFEAETSNAAASVNADLSLRTVIGSNELLPLQVTYSIPVNSFNFASANDIDDFETVGSGTMIVDDGCTGSDNIYPFTISHIGSDAGVGEKTRYLATGIPFMQPVLILEGSLGSGHTLSTLLFLGAEGMKCTPLDLTFTINGLSAGNEDPSCPCPVVTNPSSTGFYLLSGSYTPLIPFSEDHHSEQGNECANDQDDDNDGAVNDGCPAVGGTESDGSFNGGPDCANAADDDLGDGGEDHSANGGIGWVNDGCPAVFNPAVTSNDTICIGPCPTPTPTATPTPAPTPTPCAGDSDCDGFPDGSDNCISTPNPSQADWNVDGTGDACQESDSDSMGLSAAQVGGACPAPSAMARLRDCIEVWLGTAPGIPCPTTSTPNDETIDAWGPDFDDSRSVGGPDVFLLAQRFGSTTGFTPSGRLPYAARYDLNADDALNSLDVFVIALYFNQSC